MRILVYSTAIFRMCSPFGVLNYGGLEPLAWQQAKGLASRGHQVGLVGADGTDCPGVQVITVGPERVTSEAVMWDKSWQQMVNFEVVIDNSWQKNSLRLKQEGRFK